MKQFFEQYGGVALGILALLVLIAMITPVGNIIKTSLQGTVQTFGTKIDNQTDNMTAQMENAFTNAVNYTGLKDDELYINGKIPNDLKGYKISADRRSFYNASETLPIYVDVNVYVNGNNVNGVTGFKYNLLENDNLIYELAEDFCQKRTFSESNVYTIDVKAIPSNYRVSGKTVFALEDMNIERFIYRGDGIIPDEEAIKLEIKVYLERT